MNSLITLTHLALYIPEDPYPAPEGALFLKSDEGADWYESQMHFASDTRKLVYDKDGIIIAQSNDVSALWPIDMSVSEIVESDIPAGFPASGNLIKGWLYQEGKIIPAPIDYIGEATRRRDIEMIKVSTRITQLVEAQDDGDITASELKELEALRGYRSQLRKLDVKKAAERDFTWPQKPQL